MIRVFPRRTKATPTDDLAFVGEPPLQLPPSDKVYVSCTFTWDKPEAERLMKLWSMHYGYVKVGGPAYDDPGGDFDPGRYLKQGYVITTRGCPNHCGFCLVPKREGKLRCLPIEEGWNVQDNNLLAAPRSHIQAVLDMLSRQHAKTEFTGGLEAARLEEWFVKAITEIRFKRVYFGYDRPSEKKAVLDAIRLMRNYGYDYHKISVYVLVGYGDDTVAAAEVRLQAVVDAGAVPYPMYYRPVEPMRRDRKWADLVGRILSQGGGRYAPPKEPVEDALLFAQEVQP